MKQRLETTKVALSEEKVLTKDLTFDLTRQYKTLQLHSQTRIELLEATVKRLTEELSMHSKTCILNLKHVHVSICV